MRLKSVMYFPSGNVAAFDENGQQVAEEQENAFILDLKDKAARACIGPKTTVHIWGAEQNAREFLATRGD